MFTTKIQMHSSKKGAAPPLYPPSDYATELKGLLLTRRLLHKRTLHQLVFEVQNLAEGDIIIVLHKMLFSSVSMQADGVISAT